jgi:hypothetical protein
MPPADPANAALMKEVLLLHVLITTNPDYDPTNADFDSGQDILDQIKTDFNNAMQLPAGAARWDWDECSKIDTGDGVKLHQKLANDLFALAADIDPVISNAAQPSVTLVPGWSGGPPAHPPVGDLIALLSIKPSPPTP